MNYSTSLYSGSCRNVRIIDYAPVPGRKDSLVLSGPQVGCTDVVGAIASSFPELVVDLYETVDAGDDERVRGLQSTALDVRSALKRSPCMVGVDTALSVRDVEFSVGGFTSTPPDAVGERAQ